MIRLRDIRIQPKLIGLFVASAIIPLLVVGLISSKLATDALMEKSFNQLLTIQDIRKTQIEQSFNSWISELRLLSSSAEVQELMVALKDFSFADPARALGFNPATADYQKLSGRYRPLLQEFIQVYGFYDLLIVDAVNGTVLFTVAQKDDLGTNLSFGSYRSSGLSEAWQNVLKDQTTAVVDFQKYSSNQNEASAFIAEPIRDGKGNITAVLVLEMSDTMITGAVDSRSGMGQSGESYLFSVSADRQRFEFRSNVKTMGDGSYVVGRAFSPLQYWTDALENAQGHGMGLYKDSAEHDVLVAYDKLQLPGMNWFLISKIDQAEVTTSVRHLYVYISLAAAIILLFISFGAVTLAKHLNQPLLADIQFAKAISDGEFHTVLEMDQKDELGDLTKALNRMAGNLKDLDWLKQGKENLDDQLRGEQPRDELSKRLVKTMTIHMGALFGAFYLCHGEELVLTASYQFSDRGGNFNRFHMGEGMVGQSALENEVIQFSQVTDATPAYNYGGGEIRAEHFIAVPLAVEGTVVGILLLASAVPFDELKKEYIRQNAENVAILLNAAISRQVIQNLLEDSRRHQDELKSKNATLEEQTIALTQSEAELQAQQEELRVANEELEAQTVALKESEAELQAQQEELRVTNEELEERTKALEEQKEEMGRKNIELVKAQEIVREKARDLEQTSRYKSEFLANMSHELRTPLNSILILSQILRDNKEQNLSEKQVEAAAAINSSGADLLELINEILDLSKIEAGKIDLTIEPVELQQVCNDLNRIFSEIAVKQQISFRTELSADVPQQITTDNQRLQQILRNLLANAFKFTHQGEVALRIGLPPRELLEGTSLQADQVLAFTVKDDGIGIPKDKQEAIFGAFQQADGSTSRKYGGTGLGLSISKELATLLGGVIRLKSEEGQGSTFTVILPQLYAGPHTLAAQMRDADEPQQNSAQGLASGAKATAAVGAEKAPRPAASEPGPVLLPALPAAAAAFLDDDREVICADSRSLLIIEDDKNFAKILRDFGRERGFLCLVAGDGETGLHFADYYRPSAIILDIGLPGINGWTVMERLKEDPVLRHIPVHFMSANDSSRDAMRMGAIGFLCKPVSLADIDQAFGKIESLLAKPVRHLLLVEDDKIQCDSIQQLISNSDVQITAVSSGQEAYQHLSRGHFDCMILDLGLEDMSGFDLLEKIRKNEQAAQVPVIIYTGRDLTKEEDARLNVYAESIIIKGAKSPERLLDESALFLHRVEENLPAAKQRTLKRHHDRETILKGKRILVVDDDMRNVFALSNMLEERDMEVTIAKNGLECLDKLEEAEGIDCILMDIMMPKMDGYEAMREIRRQDRFKKLPIIALTAKAMKGDKDKCIEAGASDYLAKPVNTEKLLSMMRVWLY